MHFSKGSHIQQMSIPNIVLNKSLNKNTKWKHQWNWENPFEQQWCPLWLMKIQLVKMADQTEKNFRLCLEWERLEFQEALTQAVNIL